MSFKLISKRSRRKDRRKGKARKKSRPIYRAKKVETKNGKTIIRDVVIVEEGFDKTGYDYFDMDFLAALTKAGNDAKKGVKCRFGHPNMSTTSFGTFVGRYHDFRIKQDEDGRSFVEADLHMSNLAKKVDVEGKNISMYEYIIEMTRENPDMFGNSIVVFAGGEDTILEDEDGNQANAYVLRLVSFLASDLVDEPAATSGLHKSEDWFAVAATEYFDNNPEIYEFIENNPDEILKFLKTYKFNNSKNGKMSKKKKNKIKKALSKIWGKTKSKDLDLTLTDGRILTVQTDDDSPSVGDVVTIDGDPAPDGEHVTQDGKTITVANGKISEIDEGEAESEENDGDPAQKETDGPADNPQDDDDSAETPDAVVKELKKIRKSLKKDIKKAVKQLNSRIDGVEEKARNADNEILKSIGSEYEVPKEKPAKEPNAANDGSRTLVKKEPES